MPCYINIEDRYNVRSLNLRHQYNVFGATATALAVGAGALAVGGAVAGGIMSSQSAGRAAKRQDQASAQYQQQLNEATKEFQEKTDRLEKDIRAVNPDIQIPKFNLEGATLEAIREANRVTENTINQIERIAPGSAQARQQTGAIINSWLRGQIPSDVQQQVLQTTAEFAGAGFNPATAGRVGGFQMAQGQLARNLGLTSFQIQQAGMEADWKRTAEAFRFYQSPVEMMTIGLTGRAQDIGIEERNIANRFRQLDMIGDINTQLYAARTGQAEGVYGTQMESIKTRLAADQAGAQAIQGIASATSGALSGIGAAKQRTDYIGALNNLSSSMKGAYG
jgi:hypothetical protein